MAVTALILVPPDNVRQQGGCSSPPADLNCRVRISRFDT
jgi:hypothetical protein